jgi:hypothetical protein
VKRLGYEDSLADGYGMFPYVQRVTRPQCTVLYLYGLLLRLVIALQAYICWILSGCPHEQLYSLFGRHLLTRVLLVDYRLQTA